MLTAEWDIERARKVWEQEAREEGVEEGKLDVAFEMKRRNFTDDVIAEIVKLPIETVREIRV